MSERAYDLSERLLLFATDVIKLTEKLRTSYTEIHIGKQLLRSSTSCGANYEEACGAESSADFIHKLQIVLKEMKESRYWLRLLQTAKIADIKKIEILFNESDELIRIIAKSISTAKKRKLGI